uniref:Uncharacterized protein n=1 Tax=Rhizophora mucronata TaxID=61149 RepID=A0A2P2JBI0_RHIMU
MRRNIVKCMLYNASITEGYLASSFRLNNLDAVKDEFVIGTVAVLCFLAYMKNLDLALLIYFYPAGSFLNHAYSCCNVSCCWTRLNLGSIWVLAVLF